MGVIMGAATLMEIFKEKYYRDLNGGILEAFGILFSEILNPIIPLEDEESKSFGLQAHLLYPRLKPLFDYLTFNKKIVDIEDYDEKSFYLLN